MNKETLVILGGSILQLPLICETKKKGYNIILVDIDNNAVGKKYADEFINLSTNDEINIYKVIKNRTDIKAILTAATDLPIRTISILSSKMGLKSLPVEVACYSTDKLLMIEKFAEYGVNIPQYLKIKDASEARKFNFPGVLKPSVGSGSRGIKYVSDFERLNDSVRYTKKYSKSDYLLLEEYIGGKEVSVEIIVIEGDINILQITDKVTTGFPHFVELKHYQPSILSNYEQELIKIEARKAVKSLNIMNGPAHVEIKVYKNKAYVIEVGARLGGDFITSDLVPLSTGINMVGLMIDIFTENKIENIKNVYTKNSAVYFLSSEPGIIKSIDVNEKIKEIKGLKKFGFFKKEGDVIQNIKNSNDRIGYIIVQANSREECDNVITCASKLINIVIIPPMEGEK